MSGIFKGESDNEKEKEEGKEARNQSEDASPNQARITTAPAVSSISSPSPSYNTVLAETNDAEQEYISSHSTNITDIESEVVLRDSNFIIEQQTVIHPSSAMENRSTSLVVFKPSSSGSQTNSSLPTASEVSAKPPSEPSFIAAAAEAAAAAAASTTSSSHSVTTGTTISQQVEHLRQQTSMALALLQDESRKITQHRRRKRTKKKQRKKRRGQKEGDRAMTTSHYVPVSSSASAISADKRRGKRTSRVREEHQLMTRSRIRQRSHMGRSTC